MKTFFILTTIYYDARVFGMVGELCVTLLHNQDFHWVCIYWVRYILSIKKRIPPRAQFHTVVPEAMICCKWPSGQGVWLVRWNNRIAWVRICWIFNILCFWKQSHLLYFTFTIRRNFFKILSKKLRGNRLGRHVESTCRFPMICRGNKLARLYVAQVYTGSVLTIVIFINQY